MSRKIKIRYQSLDDAATELIRLIDKINSHPICSDLVKTQGKTCEEVDNLIAELEYTHNLLADLFELTREVLIYTDAAFKEADNRAMALIESI